MQRQNLKLKISNFELWFLVLNFQLLVIFGLCGCAVVKYIRPEKPPYDKQLSESYYRTKLKESSSADVLATIHKPKYEQLSQSKNAVASAGQKKKGYKTWFNMVAFDENKLTAKRKYFFMVDERPKRLWIQPKRILKFDSKMVLETEVFDKPYANENSRRIAILTEVLKSLREDIDELGQDNKELAICGMLINQTLKTILVILDSSPVLASKLSTTDGLYFDHITLGAGSIWMLVADDIVDVEIRVNSFVRTHDDPFRLED